MEIYILFFYVSYVKNICFRPEIRMFYEQETYGPRMEDIKNISS